ncbi:MAG: alkaline phosphatase family protein [Candidatus Omnitrophota bacterium]
MKKILYIILDGLGDLPIKELGKRTPLEAALTPNLDRLAQTGITGIVYPLGKDIAPESDAAVISLLGYDVLKYYTGRGPLEAFAEGLSIVDGNLALRVNFATAVDGGLTIKDRRVGRSLTPEEADNLTKEINSKVILSNATFEFKNTVGHRGVLVIRGMHSSLSGYITNTDPAYARDNLFGQALDKFQDVIQESKPMPGYENSLEAIEAAGLLNEFTQKSHQVLNNSTINKKRVFCNLLPANIILCRSAGDSLPKLPILSSLYNNLKMGCFVEMPVERGIALLTGMDIVDIPSSTGHLDVDYPVWVKVILDALNRYDGLYIHIKAPDEPGHDGDFIKKKEIIEMIDKFFFANLISKINLRDFIVCISADHSTPCVKKAHSQEPLPLVICGSGIPPDGSLSFSEKAAKLGSLGELQGSQVMPLLLKYATQLRDGSRNKAKVSP